jgi:alkaline phosphatase D
MKIPASFSRLLVPLLFFTAGKVSLQAGDSPTLIEHFAYGSCCHQDKVAPIWDKIVATNPQLFLFMGDNIYGDTDDMVVLRAKYAKLGKTAGYQKLLATCPVLGAWDDHDYGRNDAGAEYPMKKESQKVFADFFALPADSPVRHREGTYDVHTYGPEGRRLQVILLDTRYFRSPLLKAENRPKGVGPYGENLDKDATILGQEQWAWLEKTLREPADLRVIVSSIQVLANGHKWESWERFPEERKRLLGLIRDTKAGATVFLSGDRHLAEISRIKPGHELDTGAPLVDVTSSSLTNSGGGNNDEPNEFRVSKGLFQGLNFGTMSIDWEKRSATARIIDETGAGVFSEVIAF